MAVDVLPLFEDLDFFRQANPTLAGLPDNLLLLSLEGFGVAQGFQFSPFVDLEYYANSYPDLAGLSNEQLLQHLQTVGIQEGRRFSPLVDLDYYAANNPDVVALVGADRLALLQHLITTGVAEGRTFVDGLDLPNYLTLNPDVNTAVGGSLQGALEHIVLTGLAEGRPGVPQSFAADSLQIQTAQQFFEAFQAWIANPTAIADIMALQSENVIWNIAGETTRIPYADRYIGADEVEGSFFTLLATFYPTRFEPLEFIQEGNRVAIRVAEAGVGTQTGDPFETDVMYFLTIGDDGLISTLDAYYNTYPVAAAVADQPGPSPVNDPLTGQAPTIDLTANPETSRQVAIDMWESLISFNFDPADPLSFLNLNAPDVTWSFAVGGPNFLPYAQSAQGLANVIGDVSADPNTGEIILDPSNGFGILEGLLNTVTSGLLTIEETLVDGNRVVVRLREQEATVNGPTGNEYDLDIVSILTINANGQVASNQVIVDTTLTVEALRPGSSFPLSPAVATTRHTPPFLVIGSNVNSTLTAYDEQGNFMGVLGQANNGDTPEFFRPIGVTYGPDGNVYVNATADQTGTTVINSVIRFDGVSGEYLGVFGDAFFNPVTGEGSLINAITGAPFNPATDDPALAAPGMLIPTGIKFGPDGNLYVASGFTSRILQYDGVTGEFLGTFASRPNGAPGNVLTPGQGPPDFTVFVFGPDGDMYVGSNLSDPDGDPTNGFGGAVLRYGGPNSATPGQLLGTGQFANLGIFGDASEVSGLSEPSAVAFGPDLNLYVASAATGDVLRFAGPFADIPGQFLGVYADVEAAVREDTGITDLEFALSGMSFGPDGNLYVNSSFEIAGTGVPAAGSQLSVFLGPQSGTFAGTYLGPFGDATTAGSRLLLGTTPEFVFFENSYKTPTATQRFDQIHYVVGVNTDQAFDPVTGTPGFFRSDNEDVLAAYDQDNNFIGFLGEELIGPNNPLDGIGGVTLAQNGNILVSSQLSNQVLEYDGLTGDYIGVFGDASQQGSGLEFPAGITVGPDNNIYVSDLGNERILRFSPEGNFAGIVARGNQNDNLDDRFTDLEFGPDGLLYVGFNDPLDAPDNIPPLLGQGEVRLYFTDLGLLVNTITGPADRPIDFAAALTFGPDGNLYISDDPSSVVDSSTGVPVDPTRQGRILVYDLDEFGIAAPTLINSFEVGIGNAGGISVDQDGIIYLSNPASGTVSRYTSTGQAVNPLEVPLPDAALLVDADGISRPTGSTFLVEFPQIVA